MKKTLILLAGYPGTGKTTLCNEILERNNSFILLSPDHIKEKMWDKYGYDTIDEKEILIQKSWNIYFEKLRQYMSEEKNIISDYPFSEKQRPFLEVAVKENGYQAITIRLIAQIDVLFERQKNRDIDDNRHMGHILNCYHKGDSLESRSQADGLLSYEEFYHRCTQRGYDKFELGHTFEMDVTDFNKVDYPHLLDKVFCLM